jgi:hypothetical protein
MIAIIILVLIIVLLSVYSNREDCSTCEKKEHVVRREYIEPSDPRSGGDYMDNMANDLFNEGEQLHHLEYAKKREQQGDHTTQLWGDRNNIVNDRAWGIRPKRPYIMDSTSPFQYSAPDTDEMKAPGAVRLS